VSDAPLVVKIDGAEAHPRLDGLFELPPGHHTVVVSGGALASPRAIPLDVAPGQALVQTVKAGRGRLRIAVTPWAEVAVDGKPQGTTPFAPLAISEGSHLVVLENRELKAKVRRRIVVAPGTETMLKVDLFRERD
jgi:hypothetical protein